MLKGYYIGVRPGGACPPEELEAQWRVVVLIGEARRELNPEPIIAQLADDAVYESQNVWEPIVGKVAISDYLRQRFCFFREVKAGGQDTGEIRYGTIDSIAWSGQPCVIFLQDGRKVALWLFRLDDHGLIRRFDIVTVAPDPASSHECEPPTLGTH